MPDGEPGPFSLSQVAQATPTSTRAFPLGSNVIGTLPYDQGVILAAASAHERGMVVAGLLAHEGGWDEVFFVAAPLIVFAGLLILAKRRAESQAEQAAADAPDDA